MKQLKLTAVIFMAGMLALAAVQGVRAEGHKHMDPEKKLAEMTKKYMLTPEQQAKVKVLIDAKMKKKNEAMMIEMQAGKDFIAGMEKVLTDEKQKMKFEKAKKKWEKEWECCSACMTKDGKKMDHMDKKMMDKKSMDKMEKKPMEKKPAPAKPAAPVKK